MRRFVGVLVVAALAVLLTGAPSLSQTGYPPGPTTTVTVPPTVTTTTPAVIPPSVVAQAPPPVAAVPSARRVALTGADVLRWVLWGLALVMAGALLVTGARRRRARTVHLPR